MPPKLSVQSTANTIPASRKMELSTGNFENTENTALSLVHLSKQTFVETCGAPTSSVIVRNCPYLSVKSAARKKQQATAGIFPLPEKNRNFPNATACKNKNL